MENLPADTVGNILHRLPIEAALQAKRISRTWRILLRRKTDKVGLLLHYEEDKNINKLYYGDQYGKMNYNYSYDKLEKMINGISNMGYRYTDNMLGSCNGLVCFKEECSNPRKSFLICNPVTGEVVFVPRPYTYTGAATICDYESWSTISGFGYCHSKNEYKIVNIHCIDTSKKSEVLVYTIGGGGWRSKGSFHIIPLDFAGIYANGSLHWLVYKNINDQHKKKLTIMAFNLEDEKFEFISLSQFENFRYCHGPKLLGGNNNLYLVYTTPHSQPCCTYIWAYKTENANTTNGCALKGNYSDENSWHWINEHRIEWKERQWIDVQLSEPLAVTRNNEFLLRDVCKTLYCYDLKTSTLHKLFDGLAVGCNMINVIPHANSLVSLKDEQIPNCQ